MGAGTARSLQYAAVVALQLVSVLSQASEEGTARTLLSRTPGGSRNAVAVTNTNLNYFVTNGNGTWTYTAYASNAESITASLDQRPTYDYPPQNFVYSVAVLDYVTGLGALGPAGLTSRIPFSSATVVAASIEAPASVFQLGINAVAFPRPLVGIAVGAFNKYQGDFNTAWPTLLMTLDGADSWLAVTGLPVQLQDAQTLVLGPITPGDLCAVHFATPTLGFAVGGNGVANAGTVSTWEPANAALSLTPGTDSAVLPLGLILVTSNGGSIWRGVPLFPSFNAVSNAKRLEDNTAFRTAFSNPFPGILFGVSSDDKGRNVYAVGSPGVTLSTSATADVKFAQATDVPAGVTVKKYPTILTSPNGGVSWVTREAPTLWVGTRYTLFSVAVAKGSLAYAVGGAVSTPFGAGSAGAIVYTTNGGISWAQAVYPGAADPNVPCLMAVAVQPAGGHANKPVWAGGYATLTDFAFSALGGGLVGAPAAADFYPVVATIGFITSGAATVASGNRTKGQVYTLLLSMDGGKTFNPAPAATLPDGFVQTSFAHTAASALLQPRHIYGITWDNAKHGWIYGNGFIIGTQNGGASWAWETPPDVANAANAIKVTAVANIPTGGDSD